MRFYLRSLDFHGVTFVSDLYFLLLVYFSFSSLVTCAMLSLLLVSYACVIFWHYMVDFLLSTVFDIHTTLCPYISHLSYHRWFGVMRSISEFGDLDELLEFGLASFHLIMAKLSHYVVFKYMLYLFCTCKGLVPLFSIRFLNY